MGLRPSSIKMGIIQEADNMKKRGRTNDKKVTHSNFSSMTFVLAFPPGPLLLSHVRPLTLFIPTTSSQAICHSYDKLQAQTLFKKVKQY